jgi:hypothetical protein
MMKNKEVTNTSWTALSDYYYTDITDVWFTGADNETVDIYPTLESEDAAMILKKRAETFNGGFRLRSNEIPEAAITIDYKGQKQVM